MNRTATALILACTLGTLHAAAAAVPPFRVQPEERPIQWTLWNGTNQVLVYSFDPAKFKPYVKELRTTTGQNVLRDAPHDHLHHHALMYGIRVNGVNFWEETPGNGVQKPVQSPPPELGTSVDGRPQVRIQQLIHWLRSEDAFLPETARAALLIERRTLTLTINEAEQEVALEWRSDFETGAKPVTLTGANYHGLGARFRQDLDALAKHTIAGRALDLSGNRQEVSPAAWGAVSFDEGDQAVSFVLAGHPANPRGDPVFFAMKTPFAYLSATQGFDKEPISYGPGDRFNVRYLILLYPEIKSAEVIQKRVEVWRERQ